MSAEDLMSRIEQARSRLQTSRSLLSDARGFSKAEPIESIPERIRRALEEKILGGLESIGRHIEDFSTGAGDVVEETVSDLWNTITNPVEAIEDTVYAIQNPDEVWEAFKEPYQEAWNEGRPLEAIGRGFVEGGSVFIGGAGAARAVGAARKAGGAARRADGNDHPSGNDGADGDRGPDNDDETKDEYDFPRTSEEYEELARDPSHGNEISPKTEQERTVGLTLERQGDLPGPITRDSTGKADFIDATGQKWDVKTFNSNFPVRKGGFDLERDLGKIEKDFFEGENVILDPTNLKPEDASVLRNAIEQKGWSDRILWYNP